MACSRSAEVPSRSICLSEWMVMRMALMFQRASLNLTHRKNAVAYINRLSGQSHEHSIACDKFKDSR